MKASQFVLLIVSIVFFQIAGFGFVSAQIQPQPVDLAGIHRQIQSALAELRTAQDAIARNSGNSAIALPDSEHLRQTIRSVLENELRARVASSSPPDSAETAGSPADVAIDPAEHDLAIRESTAIVERALSAGRWTAADNLAVRPYLASLPDTDRVRIMTRVHEALEQREMTIEPGQPPPM